jgi:hypothetical protein
MVLGKELQPESNEGAQAKYNEKNLDAVMLTKDQAPRD